MVYFSMLFIIICFALVPFKKKKYHFFMPSFIVLITNLIPYVLGFIYYDSQSLINRDFDCDLLFSFVLMFVGVSYYISYNFYLKKPLFFLDNIVYEIKRFPTIYYILLIILYCVSFLYLLNSTGLNPIDNSLMFRVRSSHDYGVIYAAYANIPMVILLISVYWFLEEKRKIHLFFIMASIISMMFSGSRGMIILGGLGFVFIYKTTRHKDVSKKIKIASFILLMVISIVYPIYRITGNIDIDMMLMIMDDISWDNKDLLEPLFRSDALKNLYVLIEALDNNIIEYKYGESWIDAMLMLIPRGLYENKPLFFDNEIHKFFSDEFAYGVGSLDFNSDYFMGEAFANFYLLGPIVYGWVWGWFICQVDKIYKIALKNKNMILSISLFYLPIMFSLNIPEMGFNGMAFQQFLIIFVFSMMQKKIIKWSFKNEK